VQRHPPIKHGKGCLNFKPKGTVVLNALAQVAHNALLGDSVAKAKSE